MTLRYALTRPIEHGGRTIAVLFFRQPNKHTHRRAKAAAAAEGRGDSQIAAARHVIAALANIPADAVRRMSSSDFYAICRILPQQSRSRSR